MKYYNIQPRYNRKFKKTTRRKWSKADLKGGAENSAALFCSERKMRGYRANEDALPAVQPGLTQYPRVFLHLSRGPLPSLFPFLQPAPSRLFPQASEG